MQEKYGLSQMADNVKFSGVVESGFCWDELTRQRMRDPKAIEPYGYKVYSQNDEDGIIHEIFERIGTTDKIFIEFGVQDGLESNCHLLLFYGWKGLWIEGSADYCNEIKTKFRPVIENGQLSIINAFIMKDNINEIIAEYTGGGYNEIDLLSIDIDGNDIYIWDEIKVVNPRVVVIEYNAKFPPDLEWKQAYNPIHVWRGNDWHGASLKACENLGRKKGYRLVGTNIRGCNAFFVRNDLAKEFFINPATAEMLYNPLRLGLQFVANHPAEYCLAVQKDNLGILNYQSYELTKGFHKEEVANGVKHVWTSDTESSIRIYVKAGVKSIEIPYSMPPEVISANQDYQIIILVDNCEKIRQKVIEPLGMLKFGVDLASLGDAVLEVHIKIPYTWRPCDLLQTSDKRNLGIDIIVSEIKKIY